MTTLKEFNKVEANKLHNTISTEIEKLAAELGLSSRITGSWCSEELKMNVKFTIPEKVQEKKENSFAAYASMYGLDEDCLHKSYKQGRFTFTVSGISPRRYKNPVDLVRSDGKTFKCSPEHLRIHKLSK